MTWPPGAYRQFWNGYFGSMLDHSASFQADEHNHPDNSNDHEEHDAPALQRSVIVSMLYSYAQTCPVGMNQ